MTSAATAAPKSNSPPAADEPTSALGRSSAWLFSQKHFHVKLLSGTAAGVLVIIFLAGIFLFVTYRNHTQATLRAHTTEILRLATVIENDIASLETSHRGYLLTGKPSYVEAFERRQGVIADRIDEMMALILQSPVQRKRVMKVKEIVKSWLADVASPAMRAKSRWVPPAAAAPAAGTLGNSILDEAREILSGLQSDEQIVQNQRMQDQEWAAQSTQILDILPKLERSVVEMEKEKRGYLLTGEASYVEAFKRATAAFANYRGYLSILVAHNPDQAALLREIRVRLDKWLSLAGPEMEAKGAGRNLPSAASEPDGGERMMSEIQRKIAIFQQNESELYDQRALSAKRQRILKTSALGILCFLAVALLVVSNSYSCVLVRRQLGKLDGVETRIKSIMHNILDGMITVDGKGVICSMNPAAEKMFGCVSDEMIGHKFTKLVPKCYELETDEAALPCEWDDLARRTGSTALALGKTRRNAVTFPIEISLSEITVDDNLLYVAMVRDVTERRRFETEIAGEKESLAVTLRSIGDGVITTDVQGRIMMINNAGEALTGWESPEAIGQPLKTVFNVTIDLAAQARAQKSGYRNEAHSILLNLPDHATLVSKNGDEHVVEQVASPIRDSKNEVVGVVLVFRDITERQRNEAERRKADTLEQLGLLAGGIAHDFNNLLTAIIGNISPTTRAALAGSGFP